MKQLLSFLLAVILLVGLCPAHAAQDDSGRLLEALAPLLEQADTLTDEQLSEQIDAIARTLGLTLTPSQLEALVQLCRRLSAIDGTIDQQLEQGQQAVQTILEFKEKTRGFMQRLRDAFARIAAFLSRVSALFDRLSQAADRAQQTLAAALPLIPAVSAGSAPSRQPAGAAWRQTPCS